jgi:short subunit dehydrogenase-like uncharacterized protein
VVVVDTTDETRVDELARSTRIVVTTVGPYARYGLPLARACAVAGTDYADLTGEVLYVRDLIDSCHETAVRTGARLVTSCGFDSVPSDLGVHLLFEEALREAGEGITDTTLLVTAMSGGFSGGTIGSTRAQLEAITADPAKRKVVFDPFSLSADRAAEPDGRDQRDPLYIYRDARTGRWTAPFVMAPFNTRIVRRTNSLRGHAYGPGFRYREAIGFGRDTSGLLRASALTAALGAGLTAMATPWLRPVADRVLPSPGEGPSEEARQNGRFRMELRTTTDSGRRLLAVVSAQGDPGYAATSVMLGESALCLAQDGDRLYEGGGVLTPAVAMGDALADRLRAAGFRLTVEADA